ncbi:hypothetical protein ACTS9V_06520 [Empedobacter falsenii]
MEEIHYLDNYSDRYKRFIIFFYDGYYPSGGLNDATVSFDELYQAIDYIKNNFKYDYVDLFDCKAQSSIDITKYGLKY